MTTSATGETAAITLCAEASALADEGNTAAALARYEQAVALAPSLLPLHLILANAQRLSGDTLAARTTLRRAVRVAARPDAVTDFSLGKALVEAGAGADAVPCFRRAATERPNDAAAAAALAAALRDAQQPDAAWHAAQRALQLAPDDATVLLTAAQIRHDLADYAGATTWVERCLRVRPDHVGARMTRGALRQLLGDATGGWSDFESRALPTPPSPTPPWTGELLDSCTLLVLGEQGVGDQFQFLRFVHHAAIEAAARVIISCQPEAVALLRASGYDAVARGTPVVADYCVPLLSLPRVLDVGSEWRGAGETYLRLSDADRPAAPGAPVRTVGVVWAGNPAHGNDAARSMPAATLATLSHTHPSLQFVCLQHGAPAAEMPSADWQRVSSGDWLTTAHQLRDVDLLLTVDTGIAHLAGALGVPAWIMLPHVPDWRWGADGTTTPWYPTVRLFRQPSRDNWARVVTNVSAALGALGHGG
jgi:Flp pilus assembly protein TadD